MLRDGGRLLVVCLGVGSLSEIVMSCFVIRRLGMELGIYDWIA